MFRDPSPRRPHLPAGILLAIGTLVVMAMTAPLGASAAPAPPTGGANLAVAQRMATLARPLFMARSDSQSSDAVRPRDASFLPCTFNGQSLVVTGVTPGASIAVSCTGFPANETVDLGEASPLELAVDDTQGVNEIDPNFQTTTTNGSGALSYNFVVPSPFTAADPAASCPPTQIQANSSLDVCLLVLVDASENGSAAALVYAGQPVPQPAGYQEVASDGGLFSYQTPFFGSEGGKPLSKPIVGMAFDPDTGGYWEVASDGGIFAFNAPFLGSMGGTPLTKPIVGIAFDPDTGGYWEVASDGGIFAFGGAGFYGSEGGKPLTKPIVGIAADPLTGGYWEVASDGGIFGFNAPFDGSEGGQPLTKPIVGMAYDPTTNGYWEVASDGGIFAFGGATFHGSEGGAPLVKPIVAMTADSATGGYWEVASDGGIFSFDAPFQGSEGGKPLTKPIVGIAAALVE